MNYRYSHSDISETAQETKGRINKAKEIDRNKCASFIGISAIEQIEKALGRPAHKYFIGDKIVFIEIQAIHYIFKQTNAKEDQNA